MISTLPWALAVCGNEKSNQQEIFICWRTRKLCCVIFSFLFTVILVTCWWMRLETSFHPSKHTSNIPHSPERPEWRGRRGTENFINTFLWWKTENYKQFFVSCLSSHTAAERLHSIITVDDDETNLFQSFLTWQIHSEKFRGKTSILWLLVVISLELIKNRFFC